MQHSSIVGGSTALRRLRCPGSMALEGSMPDISSSYAQEGSDLHSCMEMIFNDDMQPEDLLGHHVGEIPALSREQVAALRWCFDRADKLIGTDEFSLEQWVDFPGIKDAGGTADMSILDDDRTHLTIVDYKFGQGVPVDAKDNAQGKFYAVATAHSLGIRPDKVTFHILQPRLDSHTHDTWTMEELDQFADELRHAIRTARPEYVTGSWCRFCKGAAVCPARREEAFAAIQLHDAARDLPSALAILDSLEDWIAEVKRVAHAALEAGQEVQGWKLVQKRGSRDWDPALTEEQIHRKLYRKGLLLEDRITSKLISPAQAESLLGKAAVQDMIVTLAGKGTTLAQEGDKRPAVQTGPRTLTSLASLMSSNAQDGGNQ